MGILKRMGRGVRNRQEKGGNKGRLALAIGRFSFPGKRKNRKDAGPAEHRHPRLSRKGQKVLTVATGTVLTIGCCLLAEHYTGGKSVPTASVPVMSESGGEAGASSGVEKRLLILDYHQVLPTEDDVQQAAKAGEEVAIPLSAFKEDLKWLSEQGFSFVLPSELKKAVQGIGTLPEKAVLLTFDGGYESFYTVVWPQLRESGAKGCVGVIGSEADLYSGSVAKEIATSRLSWNQIRQMDQSDSAEIASMGYDLCLDVQEWLKESAAQQTSGAGKLSSIFRLLGMKEEERPSSVSEENLLLYRAAVRKDALTMGEKMREMLYHEADAFLLPAGCHDAEVDTSLEDAGLSMTMAEGIPADGLEKQEEGIWNVISDHSSLFGLTRILRPNDGSLEEYLKDFLS